MTTFFNTSSSNSLSYLNSLAHENCKHKINFESFHFSRATNKIKAFIQNDPNILNNKEVVEHLIKIEFKAKLAGQNTKELHQLILKAHPDHLDLIEIREQRLNGTIIKFLPRLSLTLQSPHFNCLLTGSFKEAQAKKCVFQEDNELAADIMLHYLETGEVVLNEKNVMDVLMLANKYQILELKNLCQKWLLKRISYDQIHQLEEMLEMIGVDQLDLIKDKILEIFLLHHLKGSLAELQVFLQKNGKSLKTLTLEDQDYSIEKINLIIKYCPHFTTINLADCRHLNEKMVLDLLTHYPNLHCLDLSRCNQISEKAIKELMSKFSQLKSLNLTACQVTNQTLIDSARYFEKLIDLNLSHCFNLIDETLIIIAPHLQMLNTLNLSGCWKLTDRAIIKTASHFTLLKILNLSGCYRLTNKTFEELSSHFLKLRHVTNSSVLAFI